MKDTNNRLRNHFEHEVNRAQSQAKLEETMKRSRRSGDRFGWVIGAAAVVAIFIVGAVAFSQRASLDSPPTDGDNVASAPDTTEAATTDNAQWTKEGVTDFVPAYGHNVLESEDVLYGISTKPAPNNPEVWAYAAYSSDDGGLTWSEIDHPSDSVTDMAVADGVLYTVSTGTNPNELTANVSTDSGETWTSSDLPVESDVDLVRSGGLATDPGGGAIVTTQERTDHARRAVPEEYQSDEYWVTWATELNEIERATGEELEFATDEELDAAEEAGRAEEDSEAPATTQPSAAPTEPSGDETGAPGATMLPPVEDDHVAVFDENGELVYTESFDVLGIDEPETITTHAIHIDEAGAITERGKDNILEPDSDGWVYLEQLFDLGDTMLQTGWTDSATVAAVSVDGTDWTPVDLDGEQWIDTAGTVGDRSVIIAYGQDGMAVLVSDDPTGSWSRVETPVDDPDNSLPDVRALVGDAGVVLIAMDRTDGQTLEDTFVGGTIFTSVDLENWSTQDLSDLGVDSIDSIAPAYSFGDRVYLTGIEVDGDKLGKRHIFSTVLE